MQDHVEESHYSAIQDGLVSELIRAIPTEARPCLHAKLKALGFCGWQDYMRSRSEDVAQYLMDWKPRPTPEDFENSDTMLLAYAAICFAQPAGRLGHWFDNPALQGSGHRPEVRAARGELLWQMYFHPIDYWPFDTPVGLGDPFDEGR